MHYLLNKPIKRFYHISDIHLEFYNDESEWDAIFPRPDPDALLVLAGDIIVWRYGAKFKARSPVMRVLKRLSAEFGGVVYIPGNHEFFRGVAGGYYENKLRGFIAESGLRNVYLLNNDVVSIPAVSLDVIGTTLWTDMNKGDPVFATQVMRQSGTPSPLNDLNQIRYTLDKKRFSRLRSQDIIEMHLQSKRFIESAVKASDANRRLVVTHHLPSYRYVQDQFRGHYLTPAYASECDALLEGVDYWVFGHSHQVLDVEDRFFGTRILSNAAGYKSDLVKGFDPDAHVELE